MTGLTNDGLVLLNVEQRPGGGVVTSSPPPFLTGAEVDEFFYWAIHAHTKVILAQTGSKLTPEDLQRRGRRAPTVAARHEVWRQLKHDGYKVGLIAEFFNVHHSAVSHALRKFDIESGNRRE